MSRATDELMEGAGLGGMRGDSRRIGWKPVRKDCGRPEA